MSPKNFAPEVVCDHNTAKLVFEQLPCAEVFSAEDMMDVWGPGPKSAYGDRLGPCQHSRDRFAPPHQALPLTAHAMALAEAFVETNSGLHVLNAPTICKPYHSDWNISHALNRHYHLANLDFDQSLKNKSELRAHARAPMMNKLACYIWDSDTILFNPDAWTVGERNLDECSVVITYAHELTHAAQFQNFPDWTLPHKICLQQEAIIRSEPLRTKWRIWPAAKAFHNANELNICMHLLAEGHANWMENLFKESLLQSTSIDVSSLKSNRSRASAWLHSWYPTASVYDAGCNMVRAVELLQQELERDSFRNDAGVEVTLNPRLAGHGLLHLLFNNPEIVRRLLPNYFAFGTRATRERADIAPLRRFVLCLPGHIPVAANSAAGQAQLSSPGAAQPTS